MAPSTPTSALDCSRSSIKLYGMWLSAPTMKVALALLEKKVDFDFRVVQILKGEHKRPDYQAKNPFGQVPCLEDGDITLWESGAIIRYIVDRYPAQGPSLYGRNESERAYVEQWVEVCGQNYIPNVVEVNRQAAFSFIYPRNEAVLQQSLERLGGILDVYERRLEVSKYLAGDFFSLADLSHIPYTHHMVAHSAAGAELINSRRHVKAWWQDITSRPAWNTVREKCAADFATLPRLLSQLKLQAHVPSSSSSQQSEQEQEQEQLVAQN